MPIQPSNKKYIAQKEREDRQKRLILIGTISVLVIVLGLVGYGILDRYVLEPNTPVLEIENRKVDIEEFDQRVRYERFRLINQLIELINFTQSLGGTPDTYAYFEPQINQTLTELQQPALIGQRVIEALTEELILLEEAEKMGIEADEDLIDEEMKEIFGFFPDGTPTVKPTQEPLPTSTLTSLQETLIPPTATAELEEEETAGDQPEEELTEPTATEVSSEDTEESNPDPTATPLLQPTEYTEELYEENYQLAMENLENEAGITEETFRNLVKIFYLREAVIEEVTADVERTQEQVRARHILVEDPETAQDLYNQLQDGESFAELAAEYSTDTFSGEQGGDLGWFGAGMMTPPFESAAFELEIGEISEPVETDFGFHIIQLLGKEERPIDENTYQQLKNQAYSDWLQEKKNEYQAELNQDWTTYIPTEPEIPTELLEYLRAQQQQLQQLNSPTPVPETEGE